MQTGGCTAAASKSKVTPTRLPVPSLTAMCNFAEEKQFQVGISSRIQDSFRHSMYLGIADVQEFIYFVVFFLLLFFMLDARMCKLKS